jgi:UTP--glucose-1-phosphate uridylyltransferase
MRSIRKAVFPVAGFGTRFLPATKAMPKELLPVIDKPLIQYAADEAVAAGIDTLIFVTGRNKRAIEDHFDINTELESVLISKGKMAEYEMIRNILPCGVECIFVRQAEQLGLGHAILCAERAVGGEPFAVLLADDFVKTNSKGVTSELIDRYHKTGKIQLSVMEVEGPEISKYGVIKPNLRLNLNSIDTIIEKPSFNKAPSNLACIGRYILTEEIFDYLRNISAGVGGEIQLTDAINIQAKLGNVEALELSGKRFDCGSIDGYLGAILFEAKKRNML